MTRGQLWRLVAAAAGILVLLVAGSAVRARMVTPGPLPLGPGRPLVVVGTGGVSPMDITAQSTPAVWRLLRDGSSAALNVTAVHAFSCPVDGWLTLSAGERAGQPDSSAGSTTPCMPVPAVAGGRVTGWEGLLSAAQGRPYGARLGTLGQELTGQGRCVQAVGPGAAVAAALPDGVVPHYQPFAVAGLADALASCPITLVDIGTIEDPAREGSTGRVGIANRGEQVKALDSRVAAVVAAAPPGADVVVASLSDGVGEAALRVVVAAGPSFGPGLLYSSSTRQTGLVQLADLSATILACAGVRTPREVGGSPLRRVPAAGGSDSLAEQRRQAVVDYALAAQAVRPVVQPFFVTWGALQLGAVLGLAAVWRAGSRTWEFRDRARRWVRHGLIVGGAVPAATFLANLLPWWRFGWPGLALVAAVALFAALVGAFALSGPWRRGAMGPPAAVAGLTFLVLAVDLMFGSRLQPSSLLGLQPIVGGRFYGMGNVSFALYAAATVLLAVGVSSALLQRRDRRAAGATVGLLGIIAVGVDAAPMWGSDAGGPPALLPGLAILVMGVLGVRLTWHRALLIVAGTALLVALIAIVDWLRPAESRSHLGRFVQTVIDGGGRDIVARKLAQNVDLLLGGTRFALLVPLLLVALVYLLARPRSWAASWVQPLFDRVPMLRPGLIGLTVTLLIGLVVNDSGVAIPPVALALLIPLLTSAWLHVEAPAR